MTRTKDPKRDFYRRNGVWRANCWISSERGTVEYSWGVDPENLEALKRWLRLVDFRCEWVWGGREPCCQVLVHMNALYRPVLERWALP